MNKQDTEQTNSEQTSAKTTRTFKTAKKMYLCLLLLLFTQTHARIIPLTKVKTHKSMHRLADFAFIPPDRSPDLDDEEVRFGHFYLKIVFLYF